MSRPHRILALWGVPRSTSSAFERMMRERGDHQCFHEPFGEAWYAGEDARCPPEHRLETIPGLTSAAVWRTLRDAVADGPVFIKDFAHYVTHLLDDDFLSRFTHTFLIRDPAKVLPAVHEHWPEFTLDEVGFAEQHALFDLVAEREGTPPPVIDADDLLDDPDGVVGAWCAAAGIPFIASAMSWAPGLPDDMDWFEDGSWHGNLERTSGFQRQPREYVPIDHNDQLRRAHTACLPHYEALHVHRLTGDA